VEETSGVEKRSRSGCRCQIGGRTAASVVPPPLNLRPHRHMLSRVGTKHEVALLGRAPLFHLDPWWALGYFCRK
jgi:hypothetical protein